MRAKLRSLYSLDVADLETWTPEDEHFGFSLQILVGPSDGPGEETFDVMVCTPEWFAREQMRSHAVRSGVHTLFMSTYDYRALYAYIERAVHRAEAESWGEVAKKLEWLGHWEFADYSPAK